MSAEEIIAAWHVDKVSAATEPRSEMAGKPYRPYSGTEGAAFDDSWCAHCERDKAYRDGGPDADPSIACQIIADTFAFDVSHPQYPKEWVYGRDGKPCCTAFTTDPNKPVRCANTLDMFETLARTKCHG